MPLQFILLSQQIIIHTAVNASYTLLGVGIFCHAHSKDSTVVFVIPDWLKLHDLSWYSLHTSKEVSQYTFKREHFEWMEADLVCELNACSIHNILQSL